MCDQDNVTRAIGSQADVGIYTIQNKLRTNFENALTF